MVGFFAALGHKIGQKIDHEIGRGLVVDMHAGVYAATFLVIAGSTGLIWRLAGPERAGRFIGLAFSVAFLFAWVVVVAPGWRAFDALGRIGHVVVGATVVGLIIDAWRPHRAVALGLLIVLILGTSWAEANGSLFTRPDAAALVRFVVLALVAAVLAWQVERITRAEVPLGTPGPTVLVLLVMAALALSAVATASAQPPFGATGLVLAAAVAGFFPWTWITGGSLPAAMLCPAAAGLFALGWGIVDGSMAALAGVCLAGLTLFADGTARRVPLPPARVSAVLYPLLVGGIALLPLALAVAVTVVLHRPG